jgi:hypothetical protein
LRGSRSRPRITHAVAPLFREVVDKKLSVHKCTNVGNAFPILMLTGPRRLEASSLHLADPKQWQARGDFEVIGCDTGRRYRITYRPVMNAHELDAGGEAVQQWCFAPKGRVAFEDVLLAQKIALETMTKALAIANCQAFRYKPSRNFCVGNDHSRRRVFLEQRGAQ